MITSIQGTLTEATPLHATIEINGLGYGVNIPLTTAEKLPATGSQAKLHTIVIHREDSQTMYGFSSTAERDFFQLMIDHVSGIGPKSALTIMSKLSLSSLESAIRMSDIATLSKCPGIGKKTAERLVIELRGKLGATGTPDITAGTSADGKSPAPAGDTRIRDAVLALVALGYKPADVDASVRRASLALGPKATTEQLVKKALG
ncbi:MAG: Holliday junction branch migration protein RuvA [Opitutaceae bacterium]|jgi:Holliday junction DNA helicase RuvA|nr:Holliday junction branch migration protein RuvA [Opitutaceae bacterium]